MKYPRLVPEAPWRGGDAWQVVPAAVLTGIPLCSNATGVIPVAEAMLANDVAVGTTLALPKILILPTVLKGEALVLFAGVLAIAFTLVGWGFNAIA